MPEHTVPKHGLWTVQEVAGHLGVSTATVHAHHRRGTLPPAQRVGRALVWSTDQIAEFVNQRRAPGRPPRTTAAPAARSTQVLREGAKASGAFYTPPPLALAMAAWVAQARPATILEPSAGDGEFLRAFAALGGPQPRWYAHEIDAQAAAALSSNLDLGGGSVVVGDFLGSHLPGVDAVIGNPPFVRLRHLPSQQAQTALTRSATDLGFPMTNDGSTWLPFVTHSTMLLNPGGRLALVLPWEVTYVRYAKPLWRFLGQSFADVRVIRLAQRAFPTLSQDVVVLLASGRGGGTPEVRFETYADVGAFERSHPISSSTVSVEEAAGTGRPFQFALVSDGVREHARHLLATQCEPAGITAKFNIGYVTGDKTFFHPTAEVIDRFKLTANSLMPAVANSKTLRAAGLHTSGVITPDRLFMPPAASLSASDLAYIASGEASGVDRAYKCRVRSPWYRVPDVRQPDLILSVFSESPVLMVNDGGLSASNSLLVGTTDDPSGFAGRWYSRFTSLGVELAVHSLGGGVLVLVPNEAGAASVWRSDAKPGHLDAVNLCLRGGKPEDAYAARDAEITRTLGVDALATLETAIEDLRRWRRKS